MTSTPPSGSDQGTRTDIIEAMFRLLSDRRFEEVTVRAIAEEAGVSLAVLNSQFPTRGHILAGFTRDIDSIVLSGNFADMADEHPRDRLFDVLMARLDALVPYRLGIGELLRAARRDGALALGLNALSTQSLAWMMAAADLSVTGWKGRLAVQSLSIAFANVLRVFAEEDDPGMPRTMAKLDSELRGLEGRHKRFAKMFGSAVGRGAPRRGKAETAAQPADDPVTPAEDAPDSETPATPAPPAEPEAPADTPGDTAAAEFDAGNDAADDGITPDKKPDQPNETP